MDRRQRKTRNAIFEAFIALLSEHNYSQITVGQIIERADVGRATFYAHFETKEFLLKALCEELFAHVFREEDGTQDATALFRCDAPDSVFVHLLQHLQRNDNNILQLLRCRNNELFLGYFKENLKNSVRQHLPLFAHRKAPQLPEDFWVEHIAATFTETVRWWIENGMRQPPEVIAEYFALAV
ncbi:MAG: TetR/AcrR family transcriptional regulator [Oscillospiraceae bacterium]|nr:TetR/AcrR family transcriptional regulator [Oscillospiraceae bacterium]